MHKAKKRKKKQQTDERTDKNKSGDQKPFIKTGQNLKSLMSRGK